MAQVEEISDDTFDDFIKNGEVTLVDCWAPWCAPCRTLSPIIEELSEEMDEVRFAKLNTDNNPSTAQKNGIMSIPTMLIYKGGEKVDQLVGALPKTEIQNTLKKHL